MRWEDELRNERVLIEREVREEALEKGRQEGQYRLLRDLLENNAINIETAAKMMNLTIEEYLENSKKFGYEIHLK